MSHSRLSRCCSNLFGDDNFNLSSICNWKFKNSWATLHKWFGLDRPFNTKSADNDVISADLGTTNSCLSVIEENAAKVIENAERYRTTLSVVAFNDEGELFVGTPSKSQAVTNPLNTVFGTKNLIGRRFNDLRTRERMYMVPYKIVQAPNVVAWVEAKCQQYSPSLIGSFG